MIPLFPVFQHDFYINELVIWDSIMQDAMGAFLCYHMFVCWQVIVKQKSRVRNIIEEVKVGKLFMVDLAGSERAANTQVGFDNVVIFHST